MTNRKPFNFGDAPLVQDTERTVESGYEAIEQKEQGGGVVVPQQQAEQAPAEQKPAEPTKGVQTYLPLKDYMRLMQQKTLRKQNIAQVAGVAIIDWLDRQEQEGAK